MESKNANKQWYKSRVECKMWNDYFQDSKTTSGQKNPWSLRRICFDYLQEAGLFVGWLGRLGSCLKLHKLSKLIWPGRYLCSSARKRCQKSRKEARRGWEHLVLRIRPLVLVLLTGVQGDEDVLVHLGGGELCQVDLVPRHLDPVQQRQVILSACFGLHPPSCMVIDVAVLAQGAQGQ